MERSFGLGDRNASINFRSVTFDEILSGARHAPTLHVRKDASFSSPKAVRDYPTMRLAPRDGEYFGVFYVDSRHRLITVHDFFRGTIDGVNVHPREAVKESPQQSAAAVILAHNLPAASPSPRRPTSL